MLEINLPLGVYLLQEDLSLKGPKLFVLLREARG